LAPQATPRAKRVLKAFGNPVAKLPVKALRVMKASSGIGR
jgi:hypothetical protein